MKVIQTQLTAMSHLFEAIFQTITGLESVETDAAQFTALSDLRKVMNENELAFNKVREVFESSILDDNIPEPTEPEIDKI